MASQWTFTWSSESRVKHFSSKNVPKVTWKFCLITWQHRQSLQVNWQTSKIPSRESIVFHVISSTLTYPCSLFSVNHDDIKIPLPRRNSVDLGSKEPSETDSIKFENQASDYSKRRHTDNDMVRRDLSSTKLEFTTQKLRQEFPEEQDQLYDEIKEKFNLRRQSETHQFRPITEDGRIGSDKITKAPEAEAEVEVPKSDQKEKSDDKSLVKDDKSATSQQSKKTKRRKKSMIKKKNTQRKNSSSSSAGSVNSDAPNEAETVENSGASQDTSPNTENDITKELPRDEDVVVQEPRRDLDVHFFSDGEIGSAMSPQQSRPSTPIQSDTEFEVSQREKSENAMTSSASWKWGEPVVTTSEDHPDNVNASESNKRNSMLSGMLSFMKQKRKNVPDGLYLSDLDPETMDPEVAALYFPESIEKRESKEMKREDDRESGNGTSLPQSPTTSMELIKSDSDYDDKQQADTSLNFVSLSLCGGMEKGGPTDEEFDANIVQYSDICHNPALFASPNLVVRLNNKYYSWATACPVVMTLLAYQKPLPVDVCEKLLMTDPQIKSIDLDKSKDDEQHVAQAESRRSWFSWRRSGGGSVQVEPKKSTLLLEKADSVDGVATQTSPLASPYKTAIETIKEKEFANGSLSSEDSFKNKDLNDLGLNTEKFKKTLRLSTNQIELLNLKSGMNEVEFSVTTAYQGTSRCKCYLFKWKHNDKVVISDIDGTITKSDVLGHILPMVGKDWAQIGVAQLFSKIEENGYKMLYLSARAIGQSRATREYLRSIRQGDVQLPDGPLLLNPTSLISAFHREVIERKPEQFKIECLSDIKSLFSDKNPFYAGYGNRINVS